jgi:hypothetical protein
MTKCGSRHTAVLVAGATLVGGMRFAKVSHSTRHIAAPPVYVINQPCTLRPPQSRWRTFRQWCTSAVKEILSDQNYERSFVFYRFWFGVGQTHFKIPSDQIFDVIWNKRATELIRTKTQSTSILPPGERLWPGERLCSGERLWVASPTQESGHVSHKLIHPTAHSILRFASDAESDRILAPHNSGLQRRLCHEGLSKISSAVI